MGKGHSHVSTVDTPRWKRFRGFMHRSDGTLQHRALRSGLWVAASSVSLTALTFVRSIILARLLTPEIFGVMALCLMATRLIEIFTETGFGAALIHRQGRFEEARDTAFTLMVLRGLGLATLSFVIAPWMASFYNQPVLAETIAVLGLSFLLMGCQNINMVALQKELDFKRLTYIDQIGAVLSFAVTVGFAYWFRDVWALVYAQVASTAITSVLSFVMVPARVRFTIDWKIAKELFGYGRYITGLAIVVFLSRELDNAVIGKLLTMEALGYYVAAYTLANIPATYLSKVVSRVLFPMFSKLQGEPELLRREYGRGLQLITALVVPISVALVVLAPEIITLLYGERWLAAATALRVLAIFGCCRALWMLNGYVYNAIGKPYVDFYVSLGRLIVMGVLLLPLTKAYGILGAALAATLPMVVQVGIGIYLSRKFIGASASIAFRPIVVALGHGVILAAVLIAARSLLHFDPRLSLACLLVLGGLVCGALNFRGIRTFLAAHSAS
jgi:lipopolysaccharide exporter